MRNLGKKITTAFMIVGLMGALTYPAFASEPRNNDSNAIIYGGAYSIEELKDRLADGSGPNVSAGIYGNWQAPNGVRTVYNNIGIYESQFGSLVDGIVKKDGTVWVNGSHKASIVFSSGRVNIAPSTLVHYGPIPVYWREPKYSFGQDSLPAFVYLNYDGSFGYAIIKSCGNPVTPNTLKADIKIPPVVNERFKVTARKYNDKNGNAVRDTSGGEDYLAGWNISIKGLDETNKNINGSAVTNSSGIVEFGDLPIGNYEITEEDRASWRSNTGLTQTVFVDSDKTILFGNQELSRLTVRKFHDMNKNGSFDTGEELNGWKFTITGTDVSGNEINIVKETDASGELIYLDLPDGTYTITEETRVGWTVLSKTIQLENNTIIYFGNVQISTPVTSQSEPEVLGSVTGEVKGAFTGSLPQAGAGTVALSITSLGSGAYYWLRSKKLLLAALKG